MTTELEELVKTEPRKTAEELTVAVECTLNKVTGYTRQVHTRVQSEIIYGGHTPRYRTGETTSLEMEVLTSAPVKKILFSGWPPLQKGDSIRAYIVKAEKKTDFTRRQLAGSQYTHPTYLVDRDFKEEEIASKIEKIVNGEVVATYISG